MLFQKVFFSNCCDPILHLFRPLPTKKVPMLSGNAKSDTVLRFHLYKTEMWAPRDEWTEEGMDESPALVVLSVGQNNRRSYYKDALNKDVNVGWFTLKRAKEKDFHRIAWLWLHHEKIVLHTVGKKANSFFKKKKLSHNASAVYQNQQCLHFVLFGSQIWFVRLDILKEASWEIMLLSCPYKWFTGAALQGVIETARVAASAPIQSRLCLGDAYSLPPLKSQWHLFGGAYTKNVNHKFLHKTCLLFENAQLTASISRRKNAYDWWMLENFSSFFIMSCHNSTLHKNRNVTYTYCTTIGNDSQNGGIACFNRFRKLYKMHDPGLWQIKSGEWMKITGIACFHILFKFTTCNYFTCDKQVQLAQYMDWLKHTNMQ